MSSKNQFVIAGPVESEQQLWWHNEQNWIEDLDKATKLPAEILTSPLPPGATGIMEVTGDEECDFVAFYPTPSPGGADQNVGHGTLL